MERADLTIKNIAELTTAKDGKIRSEKNQWIAIKGQLIVAIGSEELVKSQYDLSESRIIDARGLAVIPGFVDCHTHVVFGGSRVEEFAAKRITKSADKLKAMDIETGIMVSVNKTRETSKTQLFNESKARLEWMLQYGTTTVESKSGYGLNLETELKQLEVSQELNKALPLDIVTTFLGAHGWPDDRTKEAYMLELIETIMPEVKKRNLAQFCDVWCDEGHYTKEDSKAILEAGILNGLLPKIHADAYSYIGATDLAAEMGMFSADHLNFTPAEAVEKMIQSNVLGVLLPATDFAVQHPKPVDGRSLLDQGLKMAIGTNCCPGIWNVSMPFAMTLACLNHGFSAEEALLGATYRGAEALGLEKKCGSIEIGKQADIQILTTGTYQDLIYRFGESLVKVLIKNGVVIS